jgi:hypothetical protein
MTDSTPARKPLRRSIRGGRPFFFADPASDKILNMVVTLSSEVWALRERLAALEAVQIRQGSLSNGEVDQYEFTPDQETRLAVDRKEFIDSLFRVLQEQVEAVAARPAKARASAKGKVTASGAGTASGKSGGKAKGKARGKRRGKPPTAPRSRR